LISKLFKRLKKDRTPDNHLVTVPRDQHPISRKDLSPNAVKVLYRLKKSGHQSYLVGGCVRDLLLGLHPKDFDVATDATPEQVRKLFSNSRLIGRRFKLVHVTFGREIIEVATFRASHENSDTKQQSSRSEHGMLLRDNVYGTLEDDAARRDFTVNALYYGVKDFSIQAFPDALQDLNNRVLRIIGDPETRYREDPVRMLRAARFAAKLDFTIENNTKAPIPRLANLLLNVPPARMFDEVLKLLMSGKARATFDQLVQLSLFESLFPYTHQILQDDTSGRARDFIYLALDSTDQRIAADKPVTPAFLYAALLWPVVQHRAQQRVQDGIPVTPAFHQAAQHCLSDQGHHTSIPKRFVIPMREIWDLQLRLERRNPKAAMSLLEHSRFRAAYDFLLLREQSGEQLDNMGQWWTDFQEQNPDARQKMLTDLRHGKPRKPRRRRKKRPSNPDLDS
jgi:poly(A) polymerase